jgi:hypothetical protein
MLTSLPCVNPLQILQNTVQSLPDAVWINRPQPLLEVSAEPSLRV